MQTLAERLGYERIPVRSTTPLLDRLDALALAAPAQAHNWKAIDAILADVFAVKA